VRFEPGLWIHVLLVCGLLAFAGAARASAIVVFGGGSGAPLSTTLSLPVSYTINAALTSNAPFFVLQNAGNPLHSQRGDTGTISYSVNGGATHTITAENSGAAVGSIGTNDLFFFGTSSTLAIGDVVTLSAGTITTTDNVTDPAPAGGSFNTFITDGNGVQVSTAGVTVPEPAMLGLIALGGAALLRFRRRA
jgi:MYXO-CTERM domain-containing protein